MRPLSSSRWIVWAATLATIAIPGLASAQSCVCYFDGSRIAAAINAVRAVNAEGFDRVNQALVLMIETIHEEGSQTRGTLEKNHVASQKLFDFLAAQNHATQVARVAAESDVAALRSTVRSIPPGACQRAKAHEGVGVGLRTTASRSSSFQRRLRTRLNSIRNPADEVRRITRLPDTALVPEMIGNGAGTLSAEQSRDYLAYLEVILPVPPVTPKNIPNSSKDSPEALSYEAEFKKYEAQALLYNKALLREGVLMSPMAQVTDTQLRQWEHIRGGIQIPSSMWETPDGQPSTFPDHWAGIKPQKVGDLDMISELDFIRTEVFSRYANPKYQSDAEYGLARFETSEALLKEYIMMAGVQNRMLYEVMNSMIHQKQLLALEAAHSHDARTRAGLEELYIEAATR